MNEVLTVKEVAQRNNFEISDFDGRENDVCAEMVQIWDDRAVNNPLQIALSAAYETIARYRYVLTGDGEKNNRFMIFISREDYDAFMEDLFKLWQKNIDAAGIKQEVLKPFQDARQR